MSYLLDTNVIAEIRKQSRVRPGTPGINGNVKGWLTTVRATDLYLSVITIFELERGFLLLERRDPIQASILQSWVRNEVLNAFAGRILPIDLAVAQRCATLHVPHPMEDRDALIAATALIGGMTVVTRNDSHFQRTGVTFLNPWEA